MDRNLFTQPRRSVTPWCTSQQEDAVNWPRKLLIGDILQLVRCCHDRTIPVGIQRLLNSDFNTADTQCLTVESVVSGFNRRVVSCYRVVPILCCAVLYNSLYSRFTIQRYRERRFAETWTSKRGRTRRRNVNNKKSWAPSCRR